MDILHRKRLQAGVLLVSACLQRQHNVTRSCKHFPQSGVYEHRFNAAYRGRTTWHFRDISSLQISYLHCGRHFPLCLADLFHSNEVIESLEAATSSSLRIGIRGDAYV